MLAAAVVLIAGGALNVISTVRAFGSELGGLEIVNLVLSAIVGLGLVYAGMLVMRLREDGRVLGIALASVGAAFAALALIQGFTPAIVTLLLNAFVVYVLLTQAEAFRRV